MLQGTDKGGLDEVAYKEAVDQCPPVFIRSAAELDELRAMAPILANDRSNEWEQRVWLLDTMLSCCF